MRQKMNWAVRCALIGAALAVFSAHAHVARLVVDGRRTLDAKGGPDGNIIYEAIEGHFEGELDPDDRHNAIITDIRLAPRETFGRVTYSSNFTIVKPVDMSQSTGVLYNIIPNRGSGDPVLPDPSGHVRVITGWQGDIQPRRGLYTAQVPVARTTDGTPVTGQVFVRFVDMKDGATTLPLVAGLGTGVARPAPLSLDSREARLFYQIRDDGPQIEIPAADFAFADCAAIPYPGVPDTGKLCLKGGFSSRRSYGLTYVAKDPPVLGIGFAATRDLVEYLRYDRGTGNPVAGQIRWAITTGTSQSGNYVRSFIHLGFNEGEGGRIIFDGANPNIAARLLPLNVRFGVPGGAANSYELGSEGVLWWGRYQDVRRGLKEASLLDRCMQTKTCPKIVETFGSAEIWNLRMSPDLVGSDASADIPLPGIVRRYYFPGVTHGGAFEGTNGGFVTAARPSSIGCELPDNPNVSAPLWRAAVANLIEWVRGGSEPPESSYPTLAGGDLVPPDAVSMGFPKLPGGYTPDGKINHFVQQDTGSEFRAADLSGVTTVVPPRYLKTLPSLVPRVDIDGNEIAGIRTVLQSVPLGTYTGWNAHASGYGKGRYCLFFGGFIPFAKTKADRLATNDQRLSLEERYGTHARYVEMVKDAAAAMVKARFLLASDAAKIVSAAERSDVLK